MDGLGVLFLMSGILICTGTLSLFLGSLGAGLGAEGMLSWLLVFGWTAAPIISGCLILRASQQLASPAHGSGIFLVVAAVAAFVGLAWAAITVALFFNAFHGGLF
jgi:hypothetical protein